MLSAVPLRLRAFQHECKLFLGWFNGSRPHMTLRGATPDEIYFGRRPANQLPRFEPRKGWPRRSSCALPQVLVKGQPGARLQLTVDYLAGRRHLPVVTIRRVAA